MPTRYQYQPLPLANEKEFEYFMCDLFNELFPNGNFELYGEEGDNQGGVDVISFHKNLAIQCKKRELSKSKSKKTDESKLAEYFRSDLKRAVESSLEIDKFVFATTYRNAPDLQALSGKLSKEYGIEVEYWGWGTITSKLHLCEQTRTKYYSQLLPEIDHFTEQDFINSVQHDHIVDQLYKSLKRFDGFRFIEPKTLTRIYPVKTTDEYDSTGFHSGCLRTDNSAFQEFFQILIKKGDTLVPNKSLIKRKKIEVIDVEDKVSFILSILTTSSIKCINTPDGKHNKIPRKTHESCACGACLSENLSFEDLANSFEVGPINYPNGPLSMAYGYYKLRKFDAASKVLYDADKEEINSVKSFINKYNQYWLNRLAESNLENIDLDYELCKIEVPDVPVMEALVQLKEQSVFNSAYKKVDQYVEKIEEIYLNYKSDNYHMSGPSYVWLMHDVYYDLYAYQRYNYLVLDIYQDFERLGLKAFRGWLLSYLTSNRYNGRLEQFHSLPIAIAVFYIAGKDIKKILKEFNVDSIQFSSEACAFLTKIANNFLKAIAPTKNTNENYYQLISKQGMRGRHRQYFQSLMLMLAYGSLQKAPKDTFSTFISILSQEKVFYRFDITYIGDLFLKKGRWFTWKQHHELIKTAMNNTTLCSAELIDSIASSRKSNYPKVEFTDRTIIRDLFSLAKKDRDYFEPLVTLLEVSETDLILDTCDEIRKYLNSSFDVKLFRSILISGISKEMNDEFLVDYVKYVEKHKAHSIGKDFEGYERSMNFEFLNFISSILIAYDSNKLQSQEITSNLSALEPYQSWLIAPENYDYKEFSLNWVKFSDIEIVLRHLGKSDRLKTIMEDSLKEKFDERIAGLYVKML